MTAERWEQVKQLFERIRDQDPQARAAILDQSCGSDRELRNEVESLLRSFEKAGDFLENPAITGAAAAVHGWSTEGETVTEFMPPAAASAITRGYVLGGRYEIQQLLGRGGMGAVYRAKDRELDRDVALKIIRPELAGDPQVLQRFKQELILARRVTHRNVIRIYDLGAADGIKFISMEYLEGRSLSSLLRDRGKFSSDEAIAIIRQVSSALEAAHSEGVVHRDLKPQNIMVDPQGKITVMDFGIARSVADTTGMTSTGALLGTPAYMSPEQARSEPVDARSDVFSLGIIFYELLTGQIPFQSDTAMGSLLKRCQEPAIPPKKIEPSIPQPLNDIVLRALATRPEARYQSAVELLTDLEVWRETKTARPAPKFSSSARRWKIVVAGLAVLLIGGVARLIIKYHLIGGAPNAPKPISVLVADFENNTSDPVFDGTLEPMFTLGLEGASFITSYRTDQAHRLVRQLQPASTRLDLPMARLLAAREGINVILSGSISRERDRFQVAVRAVDGVTGATIIARDSGAVQRDGVLAAVGKLVPPIRQALGDVTPESVQLASGETYTSVSLDAAHDYAAGQAQQWLGKLDEAAMYYSKAVQEDPNFGRAYAGLAAVYQNRGRHQEAEENYRKALAHMDRMTDREKFRTRGLYFLFTQDGQKSVEENTALVRQYPYDTAGWANLALAYLYLRDMPRALDAARKSIEISPKNVLQRDNLALYAMYAGEFAESEREAQTVLQMNPSYEKAYIALALSELAQGRPEKTVELYGKLQTISKLGAAFAADGLADVALYEGKTAQAGELLEERIAAKAPGDDSDASIAELVKLAQSYGLRSEFARSTATVERALAASQSPAVLFSAARVYLEGGANAKALALAAQLARRLEAEPRAYSKLVEGEALLNRGKFQEALDAFQSSQKLTDTWMVHFDMGRAYLGARSLAEASSEFELCLRRRGEATALFLDEIPTYWLLPPVYYYLGRTQEELNSPGAVESFRSYISLKSSADRDPLLADAQRRMAALQ